MKHNKTNITNIAATLVVAAIMIFALLFAPVSAQAQTYVADYYQLRDALSGGASTAGRTVVLTQDINVQYWTPIDDFRGELNGAGYTITLSSYDYRHGATAGLFGGITSGNVKIRNLNVTTGFGAVNAQAYNSGNSRAFAGGLIGIVAGGSVLIENVSFNGYVQASSFFDEKISGIYENPFLNIPLFLIQAPGLLPDWIENIITLYDIYNFISDAFSDKGSYAYAGGLIGYVTYNANVRIVNSFARGSVTADAGASFIEGSALFGAIRARSYGGGFVGLRDSIARLEIENSYVTNDIYATATPPPLVAPLSNAGALIGSGGITDIIGRNYRLNTQNLSVNKGTFPAFPSGNTNTTGINSALTETQMRNQNSFVGWNFNIIWAINSTINYGFPYHREIQNIVLEPAAPSIEFTNSFFYRRGSGIPLDFAVDMPLSSINSIQVNGVTLTQNTHFTAGGSTEVSLLTSFLRTLQAGYQTLTINFTGGISSTAHFLVVESAVTFQQAENRISAGVNHSLAIMTDGTLWAWGQNNSGQLGDGSTESKSEPVKVGAYSDWVFVSAGNDYSLGIRGNGTLWAWGNNGSGQLGVGGAFNRLEPTQVEDWTDFIYVSAGGSHALAIRGDGSLYAWGNNWDGQLGNNSTTTQRTPVKIGTATNWESVSAGSSHSMGVRTDGTLWAWGWNWFGQLGLGTDITNQTTPRQITSLGTDVLYVSAGSGTYTLAMTRTDGRLWAWGWNLDGALGTGSSSQQNTPRPSGLYGVFRISAGLDHSVAITGNGELWTWGRNNHGQLGDGTTNHSSIQSRSGVTNLVAVSAGANHTIAMRNDGSIWAWGNNEQGQLGVGDYINRNSPTMVTKISGTANISVSQVNPNFGEHFAGYAEPPGQIITITNTGNLNVKLNELPIVPNWTLTAIATYGNWTTPLLPGETRIFALSPNNGLALGTYNPTINITGSDGVSVHIYPIFNVVEPDGVISLTPSVDRTFSPATFGYGSQIEHVVTVNNTGIPPTGDLTVALSGSNPGSFTLSTQKISSIAVGVNGVSFTVRPNTGLDVGTYTATVTVSGGKGISESFNVSFTVTKAVGAAVSGPPTSSGTPTMNSITVNPVTNTGSTGQSVVYAINQTSGLTGVALNALAWQSGTIFNGLSNGTTYYVYARTAENANYNAGTAQWSVGISTQNAIVTPTWCISLMPPGNKIFDAMIYGYGTQTVHSVTINNNCGNQPTGNLSVALSGANAGSFTLSTTSINSIAVGGNSNFTVRPNTGLAEGTYTAIVTVSGDNGISESFDVSFTVNPEPVWCISLDTLDAIFFDSATVGYGAQAAHSVTINNCGNQPTGNLTVALSGANLGSFTLSTTAISSIAADGNSNFTVRPNTELAAGTYTATVTVSGSNVTTQEFDVSFTVEKPAYVYVSNFSELQSAITSYRTATEDRVIYVTAGFCIDSDLYIYANAYGYALTITSADAANPVTLTRCVEGDYLFFILDGAHLILENIVIDGNKYVYPDNGGSLVFINGGYFTMKDGAVLRNNASGYGGGVAVFSSGEFIMTGGEISDNSASYGGGVYVGHGGGGTFTMTGGEISRNFASVIGGVHVSNGTFTMTGGEISDNSALGNAGGVLVTDSGTFTMTGGEISGNSSTSGVGGVEVWYGSTFTLGGTAVITGNTRDNIYLASTWDYNGNYYSYITLGTGIDAPAPGMNVGVQTETSGGVIVESGAWPGVEQYFFADEPGKVVVHENGQLVIVQSPDPVVVIPSASVEKLGGGKEKLTISLTDGSNVIDTLAVTINENTAGYYSVGSYVIYVDALGSGSIRRCYIVNRD